MSEPLVVQSIASILASSTPLVFAGLGETLTEKAGITNLSLDGSILLSAMGGFAVALVTGSVWPGILAAMLIGALIALVVAYGSIALGQDQVAMGIVLTLLTTDLSSFLGLPYVRVPGPSVPYMPVPVLADVPVLGPILFRQNALVYVSYLLVLGMWAWLNRSRAGLEMRAVGERPQAAYSRGLNVNRLRYLYTGLGGALVGLAGATYSLSVKLGWSHRHTAGMGWIALAIVIFGGWHPLRVALGAFLFGALKSLGSILQPIYPNVPSQVFQAAPFALMIITLLFTSTNLEERLPAWVPLRARRTLGRMLRGAAPAGLGQRFEQG